MEIKRVLLKDIVADYPTEKIINWDFIEITDSTRLYYKLVEGDKSGFYFYVADAISYLSLDDTFNPEETEVECLYQGIALFDGIRHLYLGARQTDNEGYTYYPNLDLQINTLLALKNLTLEYCQED